MRFPIALLSAAALVPESSAATITRNNTANGAQLAAAWTGGVVPGASDVALWNNTSATATTLDASLTWGGIQVANLGSAATLTLAAGRTLTLGASGIDMSGAGQNFTITANTLAVSASQSWTVASTKTFLRTGGTTSFAAGAITTFAGAGTIEFGGSQALSGSGDWIIDGAGLTVLNNLQTGSTISRTGGTTLNNGTIKIQTSLSFLGAGALYLNGGAIGSGNTTGRILSNNVVVGGNFALGGAGLGSGSITLSGTIDLGSSTRTITSNLASGQGGILSGAVSGSAGLTKAGTGILTLTNNDNTFSGDTLVSAGSLAVSTGALDTSASLTVNSNLFVAGNGTTEVNNLSGNGSGIIRSDFNLSGNGLRTLRVTQSADGTFAGTITANGGAARAISLRKAGDARLTLTGANSLAGSIIVEAGTLAIANTLLSAADLSVGAGAVLELGATNMFTSGHGTPLAGSRGISVDGGTLLMTSSMVSRIGNVTLANGATWTSDRQVASANYDVLLANVTLPDTSVVAATVAVSGAGRSVMNGGGGIRLQGLQNFVVADTVPGDGVDLQVDLVLADPGSTGGAAGGLTKLGTGTLLLNAANTFSGGVSVAAGTLRIGNLASLGSGTVTVSGGVLDLAGLAPTNQLIVSGGSLINATAWAAANTPTLTGIVDASVANALPGSELKVAAGATVNLTGVTKDIVFEGGSLTNLSGFAGKLKVKGSLDLSSVDPQGEIEVAAGGTVDFGSRASTKVVKFTGGSVTGSNFTGDVEVVGSGVALGSGIQAGRVRLTSGNSATIQSGFGRDIAFAGGSLSGLANYSGTVSLETGATLSVGDTTTADFSLASGSLLKGSGSVGTITQTSGSTLAPGNSPGTLTAESLVLAGGAEMEVEFFNPTAAAGTGYDNAVAGTLDLSGLSSANRYTLRLVSLSALPSTQGALAGFDPTQSFAFQIFDYTNLTMPTGYTVENIAALFTLDLSAFDDQSGAPVTAGFSVSNNLATGAIDLVYAPIPEPSTYGLVLGTLALAGVAVRRRRSLAREGR